MMKAYSEAGTKGAFSGEFKETPAPLNATEPAANSAAPTPESLLRRYELLGKSLWIAMGAGLLIILWTVAAFVAGPVTPTEQPAATETVGTTEPANNQDSTIHDIPAKQNVEPTTTETTTEAEKPQAEQKQQTNVAKPQTRQPARRVPAPATNKVQPETKQTPDQKQQEKIQPDEPTEEQQYKQQQLQQKEEKETTAY